MVSYGTIQAKQNSDTKKVNSTCIDWYLVTTYHYSNGSTYQTSEYVGTTCGGCDTPDYQSLCPGGDGGGGNDGEYTRYAYLNFTVDPQIPGNDSIRVRSFLDVVGTGSGTGGIFLGATMSGSQVLWKDPSYTYSQTGANASYVNTPSPLVTASFTGTIFTGVQSFNTGLTRTYTYPQAFTP
ncbi:MAG: hypothetical protein Q8R50_09305 [Sediminibacterium sp.]|nr:hypothetical protein [Sediminibacterium sp.]